MGSVSGFILVFYVIFFLMYLFFIVFTDEELNVLLDRSDMIESVPKSNGTQSAQHFKVLNNS